MISRIFKVFIFRFKINKIDASTCEYRSVGQLGRGEGRANWRGDLTYGGCSTFNFSGTDKIMMCFSYNYGARNCGT